ncbi:hydrolase [Bacillus xiapuensis]|uniref:hydrolase n=1 Tax=Bacillus xiapuensis TaxID=2014075 RepID=UPI000C23AC9E|nr:hydrolase [Bacillus xiapuensis]
MQEEKKAYYIQIANGEIMRSATASPWNFKIYATDEEITALRELFDANYSKEWEGFFRAHVPYVQYHYDRPNDRYDKNLDKVYQMIYELGDEEAQAHIREMWSM